MKKIRKILPYLVFALILFFFPDQNDYYLNDDLLTLTFVQGTMVVLCLFVVITIFTIWSFRREEAWYESLTTAIGTTFALAFFGLLFLQPAFKQGTLLLNRMYSSESVVQKHEIWQSYGLLTANFTNEEKDTVFVWLNEKLPELYDENREGKDSVIIQLEKGLFGYYYINREKSKLISSEK